MQLISKHKCQVTVLFLTPKTHSGKSQRPVVNSLISKITASSLRNQHAIQKKKQPTNLCNIIDKYNYLKKMNQNIPQSAKILSEIDVLYLLFVFLALRGATGSYFQGFFCKPKRLLSFLSQICIHRKFSLVSRNHFVLDYFLGCSFLVNILNAT